MDASSTYILIKGKDLHALEDSRTLDLAFYEIGNAIVQEMKLGVIDYESSLVLARVQQSLPEIMTVLSFEDSLRADKVLEISKQLGLTFYDAAYVLLAKNNSEALVTDDRRLARAANKIGVRTFSADNRISQK